MGKRARRAPAARAVVDVKFTAADIVLRQVDELKPFPNNPKTHPPEQIDALAAAMVEFGFDQPILIDETDTILKGHGRQLAARKAGFNLVPTISRKGLTAAQKIAIVISDNQLPTLGGWDQSLLRVNFAQLAKMDYPLKLTGFDNVRLATFIGGSKNINAETANKLPELAPAISRAGDVWYLGAHRLMCGSCNDDKLLGKLFAGGKPRLMATDPPYQADTAGGGIFADMTHSQRMKRDEVHDFSVEDLCELHETNVIFTSKGLLADYLDLARKRKMTWDVGVLHREAAVPNHNNHLMSDLDYVVMMGRIAPRQGLEHADYSKLFAAGHWERPVPWAKPIELMARILRLFSDAGESVFEPYCGSGTTIIAAEQLHRICLATEINPAFVDLTVRRWQTATGKQATLAGGKKTFDQVVKERSKLAA